MVELVNYMIIGLAWSFIWESIEFKWNKKVINNWDRFVHVFIWPVWVMIFIYGYIKGLFFGDDNE